MAPPIPRPELERTILNELASRPFLIVAGPRGSGKSTLLDALAKRWRGPSALVQLEPIACSPEVLRDELHRLAAAVVGASPKGGLPMNAVQAALRKRPADSLLLLDDIAELRTLAYYPGVERPFDAVVEVLARAKAPCVATTRFGYWLRQHVPDAPVRALPPLTIDELTAANADDPELVLAVTSGLAVHAARLLDGNVEPTLVGELARGGGIDAECRATMAELLHRARGYGACKWVLRVLAHEQGLNLTEVSRRLDRTPGSTRDYLRWLQEVDLVVSREKRYFYTDPILRLWMRIHGQGEPARLDDVRREVATYIESAKLVESGALGPTDEEEAFTFPPAPSEDLVEID